MTKQQEVVSMCKRIMARKTAFEPTIAIMVGGRVYLNDGFKIALASGVRWQYVNLQVSSG